MRTQLARHGADLMLAGAAFAAVTPWLGRISAKADLLAQFLIQATLATALLLAWMLIARRPWRAALAGLCLLTQLATLQWPGSGAAAGEAAGRVVFFNVWARNLHHDETLDFVRASGADVVVLAEVDDAWSRALDGLADLYPHRIDCLGQSSCDVVMLTRRAPLATRAQRDAQSGAPYVEARIELGGRELTIAGTHLARPISDGSLPLQLDQVRYLAKQLNAATGPKLLVGDLNAVGWARVAGELGRLAGLHPVTGSIEGSWPATLPWPLRIPIDNALGTGDFGGAIRHVGPALGSDHRPITVDLPAPIG